MKTYNGVTVSLFKNNGSEELSVSGFGHIGQLYAGDQITMRLELKQIEGAHRILLASNAERENVRNLRDLGGSVFEHAVQVIPPPQRNQNARFDRVDIQTNCVHLVEMDQDGKVSVVNILIIDQNGEFYLIFHPTYVVQAYLGERGVAVPALWGQGGFQELVPIIQKHYGKRQDLPAVSLYQEEVVDTSRLPDDDHLVVKFWSVRKGTGMAIAKDGRPVKIFWKNINSPLRVPRYLLSGEMVRAGSFAPLKDAKPGQLTEQCLNVSRVEFDAVAAEEPIASTAS